MLRFFTITLLGCFLYTGCAYQSLRREFEENQQPRVTIIDSTWSPSTAGTHPPRMDDSRSFLQEITEAKKEADVEPATFYLLPKEKELEFLSLASEESIVARLGTNVNLDLFLYLAYRRSPRLQNFKQKWEAMKQRYSQAEFLSNLLDQYASFTRSLDLKTGSGMQSPMSAAPFPKSPALMARVITADVEMARVEYQMAIRDLMVQMVSDYWEYFYLNKAIPIYEEQIRLWDTLESIAQSRFRAARGSYADVLNIQAAMAQTQVELQTMRQEQEKMRVRLLSNVNLKVETRLGNIEEPGSQSNIPSLEAVRNLALQQRLEIRQVQAEKRRLTEMISVARAEIYPNFTPGLSYLEKGMEKSGFPEKTSSGPDLNFAQRESYLREMRIELASLQKKEENVRQETLAETQEIYVALDTARRTIVLNQDKLIPIARESLKVIQTAYQVGKETDYLMTLNAARALLQAKIDMEKSRRDYRQKLSALEKIANQRLGGSK